MTAKNLIGLLWSNPLERVKREPFDTFNHPSFPGFEPGKYSKYWNSIQRGHVIFGYEGDDVLAMADGLILRALSGEVYIRHDSGNESVTSIYAYVDPSVEKDQIVKRGDKIGQLVDRGPLSAIYIEMYKNTVTLISTPSEWGHEGARILENDQFLIDPSDVIGVSFSEEIRDLPLVSDLDPDFGPVVGGTLVTIKGKNFKPGVTVKFDGNLGSGTVPVNQGLMTTTTPSASGPGLVDVLIENLDETEFLLIDGFRYEFLPTISTSGVSPSFGPELGGTRVTILGENFRTTSTVFFGGVGATTILVVSGEELVATTPPGSGLVSVDVLNPPTDIGTVPNAFQYIPAPTITSVVPATGFEEGSSALYPQRDRRVTITGTNFGLGTRVILGDRLVTDIVAILSTQIEFRYPAHDPGLVELKVINIDKQTAVLPSGFFYVDQGEWPKLQYYSPSGANDLYSGSIYYPILYGGPQPIETQLRIHPNTYSPSTNAVFSFVGTATLTTVEYFEYSLDGSTFAPVSPLGTDTITLTGLSSGAHTFLVRAVDNFAIPDNSPVGFTWYIDLDLPTVSIAAGPAEGGQSFDAEAAFVFNATDDVQLGNLNWVLTGATNRTGALALFGTSQSPTLEFDTLGNGVHVLAVTVVDRAGNTSTEVTRSWTQLTTPVIAPPLSEVRVYLPLNEIVGASSPNIKDTLPWQYTVQPGGTLTPIQELTEKRYGTAALKFRSPGTTAKGMLKAPFKPYPTEYIPYDLRESFSIELWVKTIGAQIPGVIEALVSQHITSLSGGVQVGWTLDLNRFSVPDNKLSLQFSQGEGPTLKIGKSIVWSPSKYGVYTHIVAAFNAATFNGNPVNTPSAMQIFIDGIVGTTVPVLLGSTFAGSVGSNGRNWVWDANTSQALITSCTRVESLASTAAFILKERIVGPSGQGFLYAKGPTGELYLFNVTGILSAGDTVTGDDSALSVLLSHSIVHLTPPSLGFPYTSLGAKGTVSADEPMQAFVDNVIVWDRALTGPEVLQRASIP